MVIGWEVIGLWAVVIIGIIWWMSFTLQIPIRYFFFDVIEREEDKKKDKGVKMGLTKWQKGIEDTLKSIKQNWNTLSRKVDRLEDIAFRRITEVPPEPKYRVGDRILCDNTIVRINTEAFCDLVNHGSVDFKPLPHINLMTREEMLGRLADTYDGTIAGLTEKYRYSSAPNSLLRALEVSLIKWQRLVRIGREQMEEMEKEILDSPTCALCKIFHNECFKCPLNAPTCADGIYRKTAIAFGKKDYPAFHSACQDMCRRLEREIEKEKSKKELVSEIDKIRNLQIDNQLLSHYPFPKSPDIMISYNDLKEKGACKAGLNWCKDKIFGKHEYEVPIINKAILIEHLKKDNKDDWAFWIEQNFPDTPQVERYASGEEVKLGDVTELVKDCPPHGTVPYFQREEIITVSILPFTHKVKGGNAEFNNIPASHFRLISRKKSDEFLDVTDRIREENGRYTVPLWWLRDKIKHL